MSVSRAPIAALLRLVPLAIVAALVALVLPGGQSAGARSAASVPALAGASGSALIGIGDDHAAMFTNPYFQALQVRTARLIVSWDVAIRSTVELTEIDDWMKAAKVAHVQPLVTFSYTGGCYDSHGHVPHLSKCRLPSVGTYTRAFTAFRERYPDVNVYSPWNEINHRSQPTYNNPRRAAQFYNAVRSHCSGCTIVAADLLDQARFTSYLRQFLRYVKGRPQIWGLHNYEDTNNHTTKGTKAMLATVHGQVWLTETGGIVKFPHRPFNPPRAAKAVEFMFRLTKLSSRITRVYVYEWTGANRSQRFDAGLTSRDGKPRPAYFVVKRHMPKTPTPDLTAGQGSGATGASGPSGPSGPSGSSGPAGPGGSLGAASGG